VYVHGLVRRSADVRICRCEGIAGDRLLIVLAVRRSLHPITWAYLTGPSGLLVIHLRIPGIAANKTVTVNGS